MRVVTQTYCVSLMEPAMLAKQYMRENYRFTPEDFQKDGMLLVKALDYPVKLYMELLCQAIFNTPPSRRGGADYELEQAEKLLIKDGMKPHVVQECVQRSFEMCVDLLATSFPSLVFMEEDKVEFQMLNDFDLVLTLSVPAHLVEENRW